jgi:hypothetical protein
LDPMHHWTYSLCHLTDLLTCMGSMSTYDIIPVNLYTAQPNGHWTYACPLDPMDKSNVQWTCACPLDPMDDWNVQWTTEMSIGHMHIQWIHWIQWTIGHTPFALSLACYLHGVDANIWRHSR